MATTEPPPPTPYRGTDCEDVRELDRIELASGRALVFAEVVRDGKRALEVTSRRPGHPDDYVRLPVSTLVRLEAASRRVREGEKPPAQRRQRIPPLAPAQRPKGP